MATTVTKAAEKIKLLDQMLEDIAGDECEDYDAPETGLSASAKHFGDAEDLDFIDSTH